MSLGEYSPSPNGRRRRGLIVLLSAAALIILAVIAVVVLTPSHPQQSPESSPDSLVNIPDTGDHSSSGVPPTFRAGIEDSIRQLPEISEAPEAAAIAWSTISASLSFDYSALEALMTRLGGGHKSSLKDWEPARRWWRSVPRNLRPEIAANMTDAEWEWWLDRATLQDMIRIPDDTQSGVRAIDTGSVVAKRFRALDLHTLRMLDESIRALAGATGITIADSATIVQREGLLRYHPVEHAEVQPDEFMAVLVRGVTNDHRDFVTAFVFARHAGSGWFPRFARGLSQPGERTPPMRRIPFVPSL